MRFFTIALLPRGLVIVLAARALTWAASANSAAPAHPARPFPQHTVYAAESIKPDRWSQSELDAVVATAYDRWKSQRLKPAVKPGEMYIACDPTGGTGNIHAISVSEGHGYGMLLTAFMAGHDPQARTDFDALFRFYRDHPSENNPRLMAWSQLKGCVDAPDGRDSASDGDLDIAYALLLAHRQWGSNGPINYAREADTLLRAIIQDDLNPSAHTVKLGDAIASDDPAYPDTRSSDLMPDHFRAFARYSGHGEWPAVLEKSYTLIDALQTRHSPRTGLLPDFILHVDQTPIPAPPGYLESKHDGAYSYNACRLPLRLGLDYLLHDEPQARRALQRITDWVRPAVHDDPQQIPAGWTLKGRPLEADDHPLCFLAPLAVAATVDPTNQEWLNRLWKEMAAASAQNEDYFDGTLNLLCLLAVSGNWWSP